MKRFVIILFPLFIFLQLTPSFAQEVESDSIELAQQFTEQGLKLSKEKKYLDAEPLFKNALSIRQKQLGPDHPDTAKSLNHLAVTYDRIGRYAEAEPLYKHALAIREKKLGTEHPDTIKSLNNLAILYSVVGRYDEAVLIYKRVLKNIENNLESENHTTAIYLDNTATFYIQIGHYIEAESLFKRAVDIKAKVLSFDHPDTAISLNGLAQVYDQTGRYAEAERLYNKALDISVKKLGSDSLEIASYLNDIAQLHNKTGRYVEAETLYKKALNIVEKRHGHLSVHSEKILNNLACLYSQTSRYSEAEPLFMRSLAINQKTYGSEHPHTIDIINNLAILYANSGRFSEAETLYKRALKAREINLGPGHPDTAISLNNLAELYKKIGHHADAKPLFMQALKILVKTGNLRIYATSLSNYSLILSEQGASAAAIFFAKQSVNILQGLRQNVSGISQNALKSFDKTIESSYQHLADLLIGQGRLAEAQQVLAMLKEEEYFEFIRRDSGAANRLTTKASYIASEEPWIKEYDAISAQNANLGKALGELRNKAKYYPLSDDEKVRLSKLVKEDEQATAAFNDYMSRLLKAMKEEAKANVDRIEDVGAKQLKTLTTLKSMLKGLGEGSVLLHYLITDKKLHIILTTPDTQLVRHSVVDGKELNKKIFALRNVLANPKIDPRPLAKELYDLLLAPLVEDLKISKAKTLMLSLDGALRYLPFSALYDGTSYVVQSYRTVMYAEAARDKVALPAKQHWKVAALGVSDKVNAAFPPLPNVPAELHAIVKNDSGGIIPGEIRLNKNFTEISLTETSIRNPVVHIASHFRFMPGTDRDSFLLLGDGSTLGLDRLRNSSFFQDSELLTLSACDTAMGATGKGTEIEGFAAIAMNQGAKAVIATLWPVSDKSTAMLMREFYRLKEEKNLSKAEALREAQLELLKGKLTDADNKLPENERGGDHTRFKRDKNAPYSHPYYWAPFILIGNWK